MMKATIFLSFIFLALTIFPSCKSKTVVKKIQTENQDITVDPIKDFNGVPYRLPRTVVRVTVPVKLEVSQPGPFVEFIPCFFPDTPKPEILEAKKPESREIKVQSPTFDAYGEPDPNESYIVSVKGGIFENKSLLMEFSPGGVLNKGEATSEDKSLEFTMTALKTATSIAGSIVATKDDTQTVVDTLKLQAAECYRNLEKHGTATAMEADSQSPVFKAAKDEYDKFLRANTAFYKLGDLLRKRDLMISSSNDTSSVDSFKTRLAEADKQISAYRQLFFRNTGESIWNAVFEYRPDKQPEQFSKPLLVFINSGTPDANGAGVKAGICENLGLVKEQGVLPSAKFKASDCSAAPNGKLGAVWITLAKDNEDKVYLDKIAAVNNLYTKKNKKRGWYFRIAAKGTIFVRQAPVAFSDVQSNSNMINAILNKNSKELARINMPIAQLGTVASIPASGAGRSQQSALELNGITGELVNFKFSSTSALEKERLSEIQSAAENISNANDPLAKKKRELEKLKTEKEIRELQSNSNQDQEQ